MIQRNALFGRWCAIIFVDMLGGGLSCKLKISFYLYRQAESNSYEWVCEGTP